MKMLSDDDLNLKDMSDEELAAAWVNGLTWRSRPMISIHRTPMAFL